MAGAEQLKPFRNGGGLYVGLLSEVAFKALDGIVSEEDFHLPVSGKSCASQRVSVRGQGRVEAHACDVDR